MSQRWPALVEIMQRDIGQRGLASDPVRNLLNACPGDLAASCQSILSHPNPALAIVTGFWIPNATPPAAETDGPLGALFLARALTPLGIRVAILTDAFCRPALLAGLETCGLVEQVELLTLPGPDRPWETFLARGWVPFVLERFRPSHLLALERVGPSHTELSVQRQLGADERLLDFLHEVPPETWDRCLTMRGRDVTDLMSPAHLLFESASVLGLTTIGIGDGGNEIGMGKIGWDVIRRNIPGGGKIACRVATDFLLVAGISNWGAYALAAGLWLGRGLRPPVALFDPAREEALLRVMVERGSLVDGVLARPSVTVDGVPFAVYGAALAEMGQVAQD